MNRTHTGWGSNTINNKDLLTQETSKHYNKAETYKPQTEASTRCRSSPRPSVTMRRRRIGRKRMRCRTKRYDCCDYLIEILKDMPGFNRKYLHKPKIPNKIKIDCLCGSLPTKDAMVPIVCHIFERYFASIPAGNEVEKHLFNYLDNLQPKSIDVIKSSLAAIKALPADKLRCLFKKRFLDWPIDKPIDTTVMAEAWISEGLSLVNNITKPMSGDGSLGPGQIRPWEKEFKGAATGGPLEFESKIETAPWPWICQVFPFSDKSNVGFRNNDFLPELTEIKTQEIDQVCQYSFEPGEPGEEQVIESCQNKQPTVDSETGFRYCDGGDKYTRENVCLKIPDTGPGQPIRLAGFNFFSSNIMFNLTKVDDPSIKYEKRPVSSVLGDQETPVAANGKTRADCYVQDSIELTIPSLAPNNVGEFHPGRYELEIIVPNDINFAILPDGTIPAEFVSNSVLLNIGPNPDINYRIWSDYGHCYEETDGPGGDEIWLTAYKSTYAPGAGQNINLQIIKADRDAWGDMDSGEDPDPYSWELFTGKLPLGGAVAIAILGYEVDDEDEAEERIDNFGDAFGEYMKEFWQSLLASPGVAAIIGVLAKSTVAGIIAGIVALVIAIVVMLFLAAWAPPDLIAYDLFTLTATDLFNYTDALAPLPDRPIAELITPDIYLKYTGRRVDVADPQSADRIYMEERQYRCFPENSEYGIWYKFRRTPP